MAVIANRIKGFADMYPPQSSLFTRMENTAREIFSRYGFVELRTPVLEYTDLFKRSIGEETDVVQKEMFTFPDRKGRMMTMRPEATAGVMRAYVEDARYSRESVSRLFTTGPMFRYERPQKGRMRQFHQINCECLGSHSPYADADLIIMLTRFLTALGLKDLTLKLNSLGCAHCRPLFKQALVDYLHRQDCCDQLCEDCTRRMETNPLRVLDCKQEKCRCVTDEAPRLLDYNCPECKEHFDTVLRLLDAAGVKYEIDHRLVRGLDYYCRTTFEVVSGSIGAQAAVAGGGRYDGLVKSVGGPDVPGVGFACGILCRHGGKLPDQPQPVIPLDADQRVRVAVFRLKHDARRQLRHQPALPRDAEFIRKIRAYMRNRMNCVLHGNVCPLFVVYYIGKEQILQLPHLPTIVEI